jgi:hypothetical protein
MISIAWFNTMGTTPEEAIYQACVQRLRRRRSVIMKARRCHRRAPPDDG